MGGWEVFHNLIRSLLFYTVTPNLPASFLNLVYRKKHSQADNLRSSWNWKNNKLKIVPENSQTLVCFIRLQNITTGHFVSGMNQFWNPKWKRTILTKMLSLILQYIQANGLKIDILHYMGTIAFFHSLPICCSQIGITSEAAQSEVFVFTEARREVFLLPQTLKPLLGPLLWPHYNLRYW